MNATEIITFAGIAGFVIATQLGRHTLTVRRILLPLAVVGLVGYHYLNDIPTAGGALDFEIWMTVAGVLCGLLAASLMGVERDERTGRIVTSAGIAYAAVWVFVFGGRLAFAWGATHLWSQQIVQFSIQHEITSASAWTAAFVLMALAMVLTRTAVVAVRALLLTESRNLSLFAER